MRKIDISNYKIKADDGKEQEYSVRESMANILFNPALKLDSVSLIRNDILARKILDCVDDNILLEEVEYNVIKVACNEIRGYVYSDVEFVKRILNAPEVKVKEAT